MFVYCALSLLLVNHAFALDVYETIAAENTASTLKQLIDKAGLKDTLKSGTFTIFAPTDAAFNRVPKDLLNSLLINNTALANVLTYHVAAGTVRSADIRNEERLLMVSGDKTRLNIYTHNKLTTINGKKISSVDNTADNGIIHYIDDVILPPAGSIVDAVASDPELSTLLTAVTKAGIANEFLSDPLTVFAPTNAAFANVDSDDLNRLLNDPPHLKETLEYHAVPHTLFSAGIWNHEYPKSSDSHDDRLHIRVNSDGVTINNAKVIKADLQGTNGVVHKVDHVLIPLRVLSLIHI